MSNSPGHTRLEPQVDWPGQIADLAADYDLTGIRFLRNAEVLLPQFVGTPSEPRIRSFLETKDKLAAHVQKLGGYVLRSDTPLHPSDEKPTYRLDIPNWQHTDTYQYILQDLLNTNGIPAARQVRSINFNSLVFHGFNLLYEKLEEEGPFVLAYTRFERGHGKYLIERAEQIEKVMAALEKLGGSGFKLTTHLEVRPFIETPSDYYTSYRLVASAAGTLLAAGIVYSGHSKHEGKLITNDRFHDTWKDIKLLKEALESPDSPYYLASRDIRSNIASGGGIIPIMGPNQAALTNKEDYIFRTYNKPTGIIPKDMKEMASFIGKVCGPQLSLCIGIDFLEDKRTGEWQMLEANPGCGSLAYNKCYFGGEATWLEALYAQQREALHDIARARYTLRSAARQSANPHK